MLAYICFSSVAILIMPELPGFPWHGTFNTRQREILDSFSTKLTTVKPKLQNSVLTSISKTLLMSAYFPYHVVIGTLNLHYLYVCVLSWSCGYWNSQSSLLICLCTFLIMWLLELSIFITYMSVYSPDHVVIGTLSLKCFIETNINLVNLVQMYRMNFVQNLFIRTLKKKKAAL